MLVANLDSWLTDHAANENDSLIVQASVHDIHLGSLDEYAPHVEALAHFLAGLRSRVLFRSGDALHMPPGGRSIIERGLRDPRIQFVNAVAIRVFLPPFPPRSTPLAVPSFSLSLSLSLSSSVSIELVGTGARDK